MKICSPQLGLNPKSFLGGEVHDYNLTRQIARKGHKIFVFLPKDRPFEKNKNLIIDRAPFKHILAITFNLITLPYIFKVYKKNKFDILRLHNPYFLGLAGLVFKFVYPTVPVVATYHLKEENYIFNFINRLLVKKLDAIIVVSNYIKDWLIDDYQAEPKKVHTIYNGVESIIKPSKKNTSLINKYNLSNKFILLYMGLLTERKNTLFLLKVFGRLKKTNKALSLVICGSGDLKKQMKKYIKKENLKDVVFCGNVFEENKTKHLNLCDIFVYPSLNEGFGLSVVEAMACAKPVVISNNTSLKELITDGKEGYLVDSNNLEKWTEKLNLLIQNESIRSKMGKSAYIKSKEFTWKTAAEEHLKVFKSLNNA